MSKIEDYGFADFDIIREGFSEYSLEDGTIIRVRAILLKVIKNGTEMRLNEKTFAASFSPQEMKGQPTLKVPLEDIAKIENAIKKENLDYETVKEEWNEYKLSSGELMSVRAILVSASLTDMYDENGDPIYGVQIQTIHKVTKKHVK
jgi:hypothetical protein